MKIRQLFVSAVLTVALSCSAIAGDTWVPGLTNPPPPEDGRLANNGSQAEISTLDSLTESALLLCQSMLSLF